MHVSRVTRLCTTPRLLDRLSRMRPPRASRPGAAAAEEKDAGRVRPKGPGPAARQIGRQHAAGGSASLGHELGPRQFGRRRWRRTWAVATAPGHGAARGREGEAKASSRPGQASPACPARDRRRGAGRREPSRGHVREEEALGAGVDRGRRAGACGGRACLPPPGTHSATRQVVG